MKRKSVVVLVACLAVLIALAGCSGASNAGLQGSGASSQETSAASSGESAASQEAGASAQGSASDAPGIDPNSLKGFWEIEPNSTFGLEATLNLEEDGFAELRLGDAYMDGAWKVDGSQASIEFNGKFGTEVVKEGADAPEDDPAERTASIYLDDGKLVMGQDDGSKLVFVASDIFAYYADDPEDDSILLKSEPSEAVENVEIVDEVIEDVDPIEVVDGKYCSIEITGKGTDFIGDPGYRLVITNKSKNPIALSPAGTFTVDGNEVEACFGEIIDAEGTIETFMSFPADQLGGGVEMLSGVKGKILVKNELTSEDLKRYTFKVD